MDVNQMMNFLMGKARPSPRPEATPP
jgi:hypothetical protein